MLLRYLLGLSLFVLAFAILSVSMVRSSVKLYSFSGAPEVSIPYAPLVQIDYALPFPGNILPDSPLWIIKATRDRLVHLFTQDPLKSAELSLNCADKRLGMSKILFDKNKPELGVETLNKGEKYLLMAFDHEKEARNKGIDTTAFLQKITRATLKHREVIDELIAKAPEDAKPVIVKIEDYSKTSFKEGSEALANKGLTPPNDPFNGQ